MNNYNKVTKSEGRSYRLPSDLLSDLSGKNKSDKLSNLVLKFSKNMREKLVSDDTLYEIYGKFHTKIVIILATASLYSEKELKKLIKQMEK